MAHWQAYMVFKETIFDPNNVQYNLSFISNSNIDLWYDMTTSNWGHSWYLDCNFSTVEEILILFLARFPWSLHLSSGMISEEWNGKQYFLSISENWWKEVNMEIAVNGDNFAQESWIIACSYNICMDMQNTTSVYCILLVIRIFAYMWK